MLLKQQLKRLQPVKKKPKHNAELTAYIETPILLSEFFYCLNDDLSGLKGCGGVE